MNAFLVLQFWSGWWKDLSLELYNYIKKFGKKGTQETRYERPTFRGCPKTKKASPQNKLKWTLSNDSKLATLTSTTLCDKD